MATEFGTLDGSRDVSEIQAGALLTSARWWNRKPGTLLLGTDTVIQQQRMDQYPL